MNDYIPQPPVSIKGAIPMNWLVSDDAKVGRRMRNPRFIVWAETLENHNVELDADDEAHAERLMETWIVNLNALSASYRAVTEDGSLGETIKIVDSRDFETT